MPKRVFNSSKISTVIELLNFNLNTTLREISQKGSAKNKLHTINIDDLLNKTLQYFNKIDNDTITQRLRTQLNVQEFLYYLESLFT